MSFFPDAARQGDIKFLVAKSFPYRARILSIMLLLAGGFAVQLFLDFFAGLSLIVIAVILSLVRGYSCKPEIVSDEEWNQVTPDEYKKVVCKQKELSKWDQDLFDITNSFGAVIFFLVVGACVIFAVLLATDLGGTEKLIGYFAIDSFVVFVPHWFSGVKTYLKKSRLVIKINRLESMISHLNPMSDVQVLPMLSTSKTKDGSRVPMDARLMVKLLNAPKDFLGMQVQISINEVQGTDYPYLYCVLIAKKEAGMFNSGQFWEPDRRGLFDPKITVEKTDSADVDVLVIRQYTTRESGYHTNREKSVYIVDYALNVARDILAKRKAT